MKRYLVPVLAGVTVFGAATAFAASLTVTSQSLGSGNGTVASCTAAATVAYASTGMTYQSGNTPRGYEVGSVPITSHADCASKSFKVTLTDTSNATLAEQVGTLAPAGGTAGQATADFSADNIAAASVTGVSIVIYG